VEEQEQARSKNKNKQEQSRQWVSGSWVMGQMGQQMWMGHMCRGSVP